jgi:D-arabinose 1-dehydrogenase-like Zn-dependent alcohol dehydrogenase
MKGIFTSHVVNVPIEEKNYHLHLLNWKGEDLEELAKMASEGKLKVRKEVVKFTEDEVVNAFNKLKSRRTVGKIVIDMESK